MRYLTAVALSLLIAGCVTAPDPSVLQEEITEAFACDDLAVYAHAADRSTGFVVRLSDWSAVAEGEHTLDLADESSWPEGLASADVSYEQGTSLVPADGDCDNRGDNLVGRNTAGQWSSEEAGELVLEEVEGRLRITLVDVAFVGTTLAEWGAQQEPAFVVEELVLPTVVRP